MIARTWRIRWLFRQMVSPCFHHNLRATVMTRFAYYYALFVKAIPNLHNSPIKIQLKDGKIFYIRSFATAFIFSEIFIDGVYDVLATTPKQIIDIGANTGLFVLRAKQLWPDVSILAFEPEPNNYQALKETIKVNHLNNVEAINAAVSDKNGSLTLFLHPRNIGGHSTVHHLSANEVIVDAYRLDHFINPLRIQKCDLLKVDCEGGELAIFQSLDASTAKSIETIVYEPDPRGALDDVKSINNCLGFFGFSISSSSNCFVARRIA
jgi:FkbM family methyltransferase